MRKFKNKVTDIIEAVKSEKLIEQYVKRPELWAEVKESKKKEKIEEPEIEK